MFLTAIAIPADADRKTTASMQVKIAPMRLSRSDVDILRGEMARLHARLTAQREATAASGASAESLPDSDVAPSLEDPGKARRTLAMDSYGRLLEILSREGRQKLVAHIGRVKTQIRIIGRTR
jgi:hypothetical protein